jgi:hypothetical protein
MGGLSSDAKNKKHSAENGMSSGEGKSDMGSTPMKEAWPAGIGTRVGRTRRSLACGDAKSNQTGLD